MCLLLLKDLVKIIALLVNDIHTLSFNDIHSLNIISQFCWLFRGLLLYPLACALLTLFLLINIPLERHIKRDVMFNNFSRDLEIPSSNSAPHMLHKFIFSNLQMGLLFLSRFE